MAGLAAAPALFAHPGHGETEGFTITHYFTEPVHGVISILAVAGVLVMVSVLRRRISDNK